MEEEYNGVLRERMRENIKKPIHYVTNYIASKTYSDPLPKIEEVRIPARRGKDDRPQDENAKEKVRVLTKRRIIRKNLNNLL